MIRPVSIQWLSSERLNNCPGHGQISVKFGLFAHVKHSGLSFFEGAPFSVAFKGKPTGNPADRAIGLSSVPKRLGLDWLSKAVTCREKHRKTEVKRLVEDCSSQGRVFL